MKNPSLILLVLVNIFVLLLITFSIQKQNSPSLILVKDLHFGIHSTDNINNYAIKTIPLTSITFTNIILPPLSLLPTPLLSSFTSTTKTTIASTKILKKNDVINIFFSTLKYLSKVIYICLHLQDKILSNNLIDLNCRLLLKRRIGFLILQLRLQGSNWQVKTSSCFCYIKTLFLVGSCWEHRVLYFDRDYKGKEFSCSIAGDGPPGLRGTNHKEMLTSCGRFIIF